MSVLVAYASKHGATGEIAERIAESLRAVGQPADARPLQELGDLDDYEAFVIGSAAYSTHWLNDATVFVRSNREVLAQRPVWLFSTDPLGATATDAEVVDLGAAFEPREIRSFRDWAQIEEWAEGIAQELTHLDTLPLEGAAPSKLTSTRTPSNRWEGPPVAPASMRRTRRLNSVGGTFVGLGLLAIHLGAPLTLMLAWWTSDTLAVGVTASVLVAGLGVLMLVANWVVLGLGERTPAEREQYKHERDDYEAADKEYRRAHHEMPATSVPADRSHSSAQNQDRIGKIGLGVSGRPTAARKQILRHRGLFLPP